MQASIAPPASPAHPVPEGATAAAREGVHSDHQAAVVQSTDLLKGQKTVAISHNGLIYRLQATKMGKLILTK